MDQKAEAGGTDMYSQLLGKQRQENHNFEATLSKVSKLFSENKKKKFH